MLCPDARVLVVDGHVGVARLVAKIFGLAGLPAVDLAFDTLTARTQLVTTAHDIVVIDANAAPMRVSAFITLVRRLSSDQALTLLMTTSLNTEAVNVAEEAGIGGILVKPFTPNELRKQLMTASAKQKKADNPDRYEV